MPSSRGSSQPRDQTHVMSPALADKVVTTRATDSNSFNRLGAVDCVGGLTVSWDALVHIQLTHTFVQIFCSFLFIQVPHPHPALG